MSVAGGAWRRAAHVALGVLVVASPLRAHLVLARHRVGGIYADYTDVLVTWSDVALVATVACWAVSLWRAGRRPAVAPRVVTLAVVGLVVASIAGLPFASDRLVSTVAVVHLVADVALAWAVSDLLGRSRRWLVPVGAMVAVQAGIGIAQVARQHSVGLQPLGEHLLRHDLPVSVVTTAGGERVVRAYGLTDHPNILGGLLVVGVVILAAGLATTRPGAAIERAVLAVLVAVGSAGVVATFSRSAWVAAAAAGAVLGIVLLPRAGRARRRSIGLTAAMVVIGAVSVGAAHTDVLSARTGADPGIATEHRSIDERASVSAVAARIATHHPVLGVGLGGLPVAMAQADPSFRYQVQPAPIVLLDAAAEIGVVGALAAALLVVAPLVHALRRRRRLTTELGAAVAALTALAVIGLFDYYTWTYPAGRVWAWGLLGWWVAAARRAERAATADPVAAADEAPDALDEGLEVARA